MAEEFQESEVIFSDQDHHHDKNNCNNCYFSCREMDVVAHLDNPNSRVSGNNNMKAKKTEKKRLVDIPDNNGELDEEYDGGDLVPPHLIVERRREGKMAFSVCTGNGRTLKGRDLSEVRNSILRMTGFLET